MGIPEERLEVLIKKHLEHKIWMLKKGSYLAMTRNLYASCGAIGGGLFMADSWNPGRCVVPVLNQSLASCNWHGIYWHGPFKKSWAKWAKFYLN